MRRASCAALGSWNALTLWLSISLWWMGSGCGIIAGNSDADSLSHVAAYDPFARDDGGTLAPEAPTPETPSPETPSPETPSPETPGPEAPSPEAPSPEVPTPEAPTPEAPTPEPPLDRDEDGVVNDEDCFPDDETKTNRVIANYSWDEIAAFDIVGATQISRTVTASGVEFVRDAGPESPFAALPPPGISRVFGDDETFLLTGTFEVLERAAGEDLVAAVLLHRRDNDFRHCGFIDPDHVLGHSDDLRDLDDRLDTSVINFDPDGGPFRIEVTVERLGGLQRIRCRGSYEADALNYDVPRFAGENGLILSGKRIRVSEMKVCEF